MPEFTTSGVRVPLGTDQPRRNVLEQMARSIDDPQGVVYRGKVRNLETSSGQTFTSSTSLSPVVNWTAATTTARSAADQGDECGILLGGGSSEQLTVQEDGFYMLYANYPWASAAGGIRRTALFDVTNSNYLQTRSMSAGEGTGFLGADVWALAWLDAGTSLRVDASQSSGGNLDGGNVPSRTSWIVAKARLM